MMGRRHRRPEGAQFPGNKGFPHWRFAAVALVTAVLSVWAISPALAQQLISKDAATKAVEQAYDVQVIRIEAGSKDGSQFFTVRVINRAGDFNEAFMVSTFVVDRRTGKLIPQFRQGQSGAELSGPERREVRGDTGPVLRRESMR